MPKFNPAADYGSNKPREKKDFHIPPGTYKVKVEAVELRQPRDQSKPEYFNVRMRVSQGQFNGSTIWDVISTGPRSFWKLGSFCKAFGFADVIGDIDLPDQADIIIVKATDRVGWVETRVEEMNNKKLKTQVAKYIEKEEEEQSEPPAPTDDVFDNSPADIDDDIPF